MCLFVSSDFCSSASSLTCADRLSPGTNANAQHSQRDFSESAKHMTHDWQQGEDGEKLRKEEMGLVSSPDKPGAQV